MASRRVVIFLLFIVTKILRKQFKKPYQQNNENFAKFKNPCIVNCHIMKNLWYLQEACGNLMINFARPKRMITYRPPASKSRKWLMGKKECILPGLIHLQG